MAVGNINLEKLQEIDLGLTPNVGGYMREAASFCLVRNGHLSPLMEVMGKEPVAIEGLQEVTDRVERNWNDKDCAAEQGAYGVSILLLNSSEGLSVVERSCKGTGFDYWLGKCSDEILFQNKSRLEVSGIFNNYKGIDGRFKIKVRQMERSAGMKIPGFVSVVEFGCPAAKVGVVDE